MLKDMRTDLGRFARNVRASWFSYIYTASMLVFLLDRWEGSILFVKFMTLLFIVQTTFFQRAVFGTLLRKQGGSLRVTDNMSNFTLGTAAGYIIIITMCADVSESILFISMTSTLLMDLLISLSRNETEYIDEDYSNNAFVFFRAPIGTIAVMSNSFIFALLVPFLGGLNNIYLEVSVMGLMMAYILYQLTCEYEAFEMFGREGALPNGLYTKFNDIR